MRGKRCCDLFRAPSLGASACFCCREGGLVSSALAKPRAAARAAAKPQAAVRARVPSRLHNSLGRLWRSLVLRAVREVADYDSMTVHGRLGDLVEACASGAPRVCGAQGAAHPPPGAARGAAAERFQSGAGGAGRLRHEKQPKWTQGCLSQVSQLGWLLCKQAKGMGRGGAETPETSETNSLNGHNDVSTLSQVVRHLGGLLGKQARNMGRGGLRHLRHLRQTA